MLEIEDASYTELPCSERVPGDWRISKKIDAKSNVNNGDVNA